MALRAEGDVIGSLAAISRSRQTAFSPETEDALETIARRAGQAIWNALRFAEAREHAELDSLTGSTTGGSSTSSSGARSRAPGATSATSR